MKNMKKVLFLLLFFVGLGAANLNSQVRIGGDGKPNEAAVLDLNTDDLISDGAKGLALPRVSLDSIADLLGYSDLLEGMLVYNTNADITGGDGVGVYYWDGSQWVNTAELADNSVTSAKIEDGSIVNAAIANNTIRRGKTNMITGSISASTLGTTAGSAIVIPWPAGCSNSSGWAMAQTTDGHVTVYSNGSSWVLYRVSAGSSTFCALLYYCWPT